MLNIQCNHICMQFIYILLFFTHGQKKKSKNLLFSIDSGSEKNSFFECKKGSTLRRKGMKYDYRKAVKEDVKKYIEEEINYQDYGSIEELEAELNETLWIEDSVTGNACGSYTLNRWQAEENLAHNLDLLHDVLSEFNEDIQALDQGAEYCDVIIRCYLLPEAIAEALTELSAGSKLKEGDEYD